MTAPTRSRRTLILVAAGALVALGAGVAFYGSGGLLGNSSARACTAARPVAERMAPLAKGEVAAVQVPKSPAPVADVGLLSPEGREMKLSDLRGRTVLLNLWATWCVPCRKEMPALDRLQAELGGPGFEVVAVNIDTRNLERPRQWLTENGITRLAYYSDPKARIFQDLKAVGKAFGMPTTLIVDPDGCELGYLAGPAEWASEDALALIRAALAR
jgi:thiol-disulfide isomerase/thioredoxin